MSIKCIFFGEVEGSLQSQMSQRLTGLNVKYCNYVFVTRSFVSGKSNSDFLFIFLKKTYESSRVL